MFAACLLLACAIVGGILLTFLFDLSMPRAARICHGASVGLPLLASFGFLISLGLGLGAATIALSTMVSLLPLLLLLGATNRARVFTCFGAPTRSAGPVKPNL